ncbi:MAG: type II toxin-antitoxin system Phd/YefM family antitoxin [Solirubrobacteraceae bacterium]
MEAVGAHEFREHLGWYLQRVGRGEGLMITRRGKPYARLEPVLDGPAPQPTARLGASPQSCSSR